VRQIGTTIAWARNAEGDRTPREESSISHAACLAPALHLGGSPVGGSSRANGPEQAPLRRGLRRARISRAPRGRARPRSGSSERGIFGAAVPASVGATASRTHRIPGLGSGCGEARRELLACAPSPVTARRLGGTASAAHQTGTGSRRCQRAESNEGFGLRSGQRDRLASSDPVSLSTGLAPEGLRRAGPAPSGVGSTTGCAVERCLLLGDFAPHCRQVAEPFRERRLAAAVIL
jgi:hypothetical protein